MKKKEIQRVQYDCKDPRLHRSTKQAQIRKGPHAETKDVEKKVGCVRKHSRGAASEEPCQGATKRRARGGNTFMNIEWVERESCPRHRVGQTAKGGSTFEGIGGVKHKSHPLHEGGLLSYQAHLAQQGTG